MFTDKSEGSVLTEIIGRVKVNHWPRRGTARENQPDQQ